MSSNYRFANDDVGPWAKGKTHVAWFTRTVLMTGLVSAGYLYANAY